MKKNIGTLLIVIIIIILFVVLAQFQIASIVITFSLITIGLIGLLSEYIENWIMRKKYPGNDKTIYNDIKEDTIKQILPNFNMNEFKESVFEIYKKIHVAIMNFDYDTINKYTTDELYNLYRSQLENLKFKDQKIIMNNFKMLSFHIYKVEDNDGIISLKCLATIKCYDYVIDKDNNCISGNNSKKVKYKCSMTFVTGIKNETNTCPSCGVKLNNNNFTVCPECKYNNWILSKKEVI